MNLLLYAESKFIIARRQGEPLPAGLSHLWTADPPPVLPDALFAELGYHGALEETTPSGEPAATDDEDDFDSLFANFTASVFGASR